MAKGTGKFGKGNKAAVGNPGPQRPDFLTQTLISQLNEVDKTTSSEKKHLLVEQLIKHALGYYLKYREKGKTVEMFVPSDVRAIKEIFDRVQGRAPQQVEIKGDGGSLKFELIRRVVVDPSSKKT